jgi:short subunit dehydrogenase-like uncharacterized protein
VDSLTHYCDLTAELPFIRNSLDEFHDRAKTNGVRIVHACASAALPAEVMTLMVANYMDTVHHKQLGQVTTLVLECTSPLNHLSLSHMLYEI